jgi:hypothetical protein
MCDYKDYFLFISEPRECKEVKDIRTNFSLHYGSKLTIHISGKVIFGIIVHNENSTSKEIREVIEKEGGWIIYSSNSRPFRVVKEVDQKLLGKMLDFDRLESVKIFSSGPINLGFKLDCGKSVLRMISNYFSYTYGKNKN